jgi:HD superfamily phosphodiesterase
MSWSSASTEPRLLDELIQASRELVGRMLEKDPKRLRHSAAVADRAQAYAATVARSEADSLIAAAWLHDIGYSVRVRDTGFHPLDAPST